MNLRRLLSGFILLALASFGPGSVCRLVAEEDHPREPVKAVVIDSSAVTLRIPPEEKLARILADRDLNYKTNQARPVSFMDKIKTWIWKNVNRFIPGKSIRFLWRVLPYLVFLTVLFFVISKMTGTNLTGLFYGTSHQHPNSFKESSENIHELDLGAMIAASIQQKKYRSAVRYLYLNVLKKLSEKDLIHWRIDKTNQEYLREMEDTDLRTAFAEVTRLFEYIWYGNFDLDDSNFLKVQHRFETFDERVAQVY